MPFVVQLAATRPALRPYAGITHVRVTVVPPEAEGVEPTRPIALVVVADRSGSMGAAAGPLSQAHAPMSPVGVSVPFDQPSKLDVLRGAAERLLAAMRDGDRFGLVTFTDRARTDIPLVRINESVRTIAHQTIQRLSPGASTNLYDGLRLAQQQFDAETLRTHSCRIVVITDGEANVGPHDPDSLPSLTAHGADQGMITSAIGVGLSYNVGVLRAIGNSGGSRYRHIEDAHGVEPFLQAELRLVAAVTIRAVEVRIMAGGACISGDLTTYPQRPTPEGLRFSLRDLATPCSFWLELTSPVPLSGDIYIAARASGTALDDVPETAADHLLIRVVDDIRQVPEDPSMVAEVASLLRAKGLGDSAELFDTGKYAAGQEQARRALERVGSLTSIYTAIPSSSQDSELLQLSTRAPVRSDEDRRYMKGNAARAFSVQRGRPQEDESF